MKMQGKPQELKGKINHEQVMARCRLFSNEHLREGYAANRQMIGDLIAAKYSDNRIRLTGLLFIFSAALLFNNLAANEKEAPLHQQSA